MTFLMPFFVRFFCALAVVSKSQYQIVIDELTRNTTPPLDELGRCHRLSFSHSLSYSLTFPTTPSLCLSIDLSTPHLDEPARNWQDFIGARERMRSASPDMLTGRLPITPAEPLIVNSY